jgi:hypothetical protein
MKSSENILEIMGGNTFYMQLMPLNCTLKIGNSKFYAIFNTIKKNQLQRRWKKILPNKRFMKNSSVPGD